LPILCRSSKILLPNILAVCRNLFATSQNEFRSMSIFFPSGGRDFPHLSRPALGSTQSPVQWVPGLSPEVKSSRGVTLTPHPFQCRGQEKVQLILLLPLWAVRPVQSLSACTRVHFTFALFLYSIRSNNPEHPVLRKVAQELNFLPNAF
jgi:hypothetical protein